MTEPVDIMCPWWIPKKLYGDNYNESYIQSWKNEYNKLSSKQQIGIWVVSTCMFIFWVYCMIKAFSCPFNGMVWGLAIFILTPSFGSILGIVYLFVGCHPPYDMMPHYYHPP